MTSASDLLPPRPSLPKLRDVASTCKACELWRVGTQTVFGEGKSRARLMLVGEQPGDQEDRAGRPFVGPAGRLLDQSLEEAGADREDVYVTNVVKHFRWEPRGKRRIHRKPGLEHILACRPWLESELKVVKPNLVVCLGATAAQAILGKSFRVTQQRGEVFDFEESYYSGLVTATVHPSSILRAPSDRREEERKSFVADLRKAIRKLAS